MPMSALGYIAALASWEIAWWARRKIKRSELFLRAREHAYALGVPLVVVGAPDRGATRGPGCGDVSVDIQSSSCPVHLQADISKPLPFASGSVVVFVSCVLEYVDDYEASLRELQRISGGRMYVVRVEPWTLTAYLYPGAKRTIAPASAPAFAARLPPC